jgi:hypothetical protein
MTQTTNKTTQFSHRTFKDLPVPAYFVFWDASIQPGFLEPKEHSFFVKTSKGKIRKVGGDTEIVWRKDCLVRYYGQDVTNLPIK